MDIETQLNRIKRGSTQLVSEAELRAKLKKGKPLRAKLGVDPTAPDIHLGHTVVLTKLRTLQDMGHTVVFIIGDFTAAIGDPSGRDSTRPPLSEEDINRNIDTYTDQVFKVLDPNKTEIHRNSEWLLPLFDKSNPHFLPKTLLRTNSVQQLMERDDFSERKKAGESISLLELLYPIFQGYDSVAIKADLELGGNDQLFNLLMGRKLQKDAGQEPQSIMTMPILEGLDGVNKMSKSYNNYVGIKDNHNDMFSKLMSISDQLMWKYYELLTEEDIPSLKSIHPKEAKMKLAHLITQQYHNENLANDAKSHFEKVFSRKEIPDDLEEYQLPSALGPVDLLISAGLAPSKKEARRLLDQGGVELNGQKISANDTISIAEPTVIKVGKRRFKRLLPS